MSGKPNPSPWQHGKPLAKCHEHMLDQQVACDVNFVMETLDGATVPIPAHRYILVCRSPVFEAMFSGLYTEQEGNILIKDMEPDTVRAMLRYMYTEKVDITFENVVALTLAAKKYILDSLLEKCTTFIRQNLTAGNVCSVFEGCRFLDDLADICKQFIEDNCYKVVTEQSFLELSKEALVTILSWDDLSVYQEVDLYLACVEWAKHEIGASDDQICLDLGETLCETCHQIRFGSLTYRGCAEFVDDSNKLVIPDNDMRLIYQWRAQSSRSNAAKEQLAETGYNVTLRNTLHKISRFDAMSSDSWMTADDTWTLKFAVTKAIKLYGFSIYGTKDVGTQVTFSADVFESFSEKVASVKPQTIVCSGSESPIPMYLDTPVTILPDITTDLNIKLKNFRTHRGSGVHKSSVQAPCGVTFKFPQATSRDGQVPELIFKPVGY